MQHHPQMSTATKVELELARQRAEKAMAGKPGAAAAMERVAPPAQGHGRPVLLSQAPPLYMAAALHPAGC